MATGRRHPIVIASGKDKVRSRATRVELIFADEFFGDTEDAGIHDGTANGGMAAGDWYTWTGADPGGGISAICIKTFPDGIARCLDMFVVEQVIADQIAILFERLLVLYAQIGHLLASWALSLVPVVRRLVLGRGCQYSLLGRAYHAGGLNRDGLWILGAATLGDMMDSTYLQLLGTGAGDANFDSAAPNTVAPKDRRRYTCNFLAPNMLIDFNNHTAAALVDYGIATEEIDTLLISHGHFDHFQPLEIIRFAASLPQPLNIYGNSMVIDALELCRDHVFDEVSGRFVTRHDSYNIETTKLELNTRQAVGGPHVTPMLGNHFMNKPYCIMEQQVFNYLIETERKSIFYGLDSSYLMPQTLAALAGTHLNLAILDATFGPREIDPALSGHLNWAMLDETLNELREAGCVDEDTVVVAAHLSSASIDAYDEVAQVQAKKGITLAYDGLVLPL
jgi:phosphoribosyl 1,2-cyclic phosphodiesterase